MRLSLLLFSFLCATVFNASWAKPPSYITTRNGVIVFTDLLITGAFNAVKLEVVADNIIRVLAAPGEIVSTQSLITVYNKRPILPGMLFLHSMECCRKEYSGSISSRPMKQKVWTLIQRLIKK